MELASFEPEESQFTEKDFQEFLEFLKDLRQVFQIIKEETVFPERVREVHERVCVFVDYAHIRHGLDKMRNAELPEDYRIDVAKLAYHLVGRRKLIRAYIYDGIYPENAHKQDNRLTEERVRKLIRGKQKFAYSLRKNKPFNVKLIKMAYRKDEECQKGEWIQKGVDVQIAVDMLVGAFQKVYDTAILISGDRDFVSVIREVQRLGPKVELVCFKNTISPEFEQVPDRLVFLDEVIREHWATFRLD